MSKFIRIAIDGGAASGKSTAANNLADKYHFLHVDTGSHYRLVTVYLLRQKIDISKEEDVAHALSQRQPDTLVKDDNAYLSLAGIDALTTDIRNAEVNQHVSAVAALPAVRDFLFHYQRSLVDFAQSRKFTGIVMEGRDIGSVILPDAELRFFFHASAEARQARRANEGISDSIATRDRIDSQRKVAPLVCPPGAISVDTGPLTPQEVLDLVCQHIQQRQNP